MAKTVYSKNLNHSPSKYERHNNSVDFSTTKGSTMNSTFSAGFNILGNSAGFSGTHGNGSQRDSMYNQRGEKISYARGYGKYKLKNSIPTYDFTGGDTPWVNKARVNNKISGQELNFKVNHGDYDKVFDSARPIAHTNARKFCSMTRFMKNLEDNRIFQRWKMSAYRGSHR